jgi:hypothetical protein
MCLHSRLFGPACSNQSGSPFVVLTCPSLRAQQEVSVPHWQAFFRCPNQSLALCSGGGDSGECRSLAGFLSPVALFYQQGAGVHERGRGWAHGATTKDPDRANAARGVCERGRAGTAALGVCRRGQASTRHHHQGSRPSKRSTREGEWVQRRRERVGEGRRAHGAATKDPDRVNVAPRVRERGRGWV